MVKKLSEQLADLSMQAKETEEAIAAAEKEAHDKVAEYRHRAREAASAANKRVQEQIKTAQDSATSNWTALRAKIDADLNVLKTRIDHAKERHDAVAASNRADELEWEAEVAVEYAVAMIRQARAMVLDAIAARKEADEAGSHAA